MLIWAAAAMVVAVTALAIVLIRERRWRIKAELELNRILANLERYRCILSTVEGMSNQTVLALTEVEEVLLEVATELRALNCGAEPVLEIISQRERVSALLMLLRQQTRGGKALAQQIREILSAILRQAE